MQSEEPRPPSKSLPPRRETPGTPLASARGQQGGRDEQHQQGGRDPDPRRGDLLRSGDREARDPDLGKRQIFLGSRDAEEQVRELHRRLDEAITTLGGLQQPQMSTEPPPTPKEDGVRADDEEKVTRIAGEIFCALTGCDLNALYLDATLEPLDRPPTHSDLLRIAADDPLVHKWMRLASLGRISTTESLFGMAVTLSARNRALIGEIVKLQVQRPIRIVLPDATELIGRKVEDEPNASTP